jgi:hypothetical protein
MSSTDKVRLAPENCAVIFLDHRRRFLGTAALRVVAASSDFCWPFRVEFSLIGISTTSHEYDE